MLNIDGDYLPSQNIGCDMVHPWFDLQKKHCERVGVMSGSLADMFFLGEHSGFYTVC